MPRARQVWAARTATVLVSSPSKVCAPCPGEFHLVGDQQTTAGVILGAATFLIPLVDRALNKALRY